MNRPEQKAQIYLEKISKNIEYEPNGKDTPPDFLLDQKIAVEVRALNENYFNEKTAAEGLEQIEMPLAKEMRQVFEKFNKSEKTQSYGVVVRFSRPMEDNWRKIRKQTKQKLSKFLKCPNLKNPILNIDKNISLELLKLDKSDTSVFKFYDLIDEDSGGLANQMYIDNIQHCIDKKTKKTDKYKDKYEKCWLLLIDYLLGFFPENRLDKAEVEIVKNKIQKPKVWEKILIVNPETNNELLVL